MVRGPTVLRPEIGLSEQSIAEQSRPMAKAKGTERERA